MNPEDNTAHGIILFDGVCNLCEDCVQFVIKRDHQGFFKFASLQSDTAKHLLAQYHYHGLELGTVILLLDNKLYLKSDAALTVCRHLDGAWPILYYFRWLPQSFRNLIYDFIGNRRYRWFGKKSCLLMPLTEQKHRFLDVS